MAFKGFLRGNTAATLKFGPFLDNADGNTVEDALTISQADVRLSKNGGNMAQKNESSACTHDELGKYDCPVDATDTNTYGRLDVTAHEGGALIVDDQYAVLPEIVFDSFFPAAAGAPLPIFGVLDWGTAQASAAGTLVHRSGLNLANDIPNGATEYVYSGTGAGQSRIVHDFVNATDTASVAPDWTTTPSTDSLYATLATPPANTSAPIPCNPVQLNGDAQSLLDLKDFADAGYDPATNKVEGVKLADAATVVNGLAANVITAAATAADFTTEIQSGLATAAALATVAGYLDTEIAAILQDTGTTLDGKIDAILALLDDARGEPGQGTPPVNPDLATKIDYLYKAWRNRKTQTASEFALYADDGTTKDQEAAVSSDGTTLVIGEMATGA